jgi:hypothetical protein
MEMSTSKVSWFAIDEALDLICGPKMEYYGPPHENLEDIAQTWNPYVARALKVKGKLDGSDVAVLMILLKAMRLVRGYHRDSVVDIIGYSELLEVLNDSSAFKSFVHKAAEKIENEVKRVQFIAKLLPTEERS